MSLVSSLLLSAVVAWQATGAKVGTVETKVDSKASFTAFRTYTWAGGYKAHKPGVHDLIVGAFDAEMAKLGFKKVEQNPDVTIAYYTVTSTEVNFEALEQIEGKVDDLPTRMLGRLVVMLRDPKTSKQVWAASTREHVDPDPAKLAATIPSVATRLFAYYPTRTPPKPKK
jgi:hypothetical protein